VLEWTVEGGPDEMRVRLNGEVTERVSFDALQLEAPRVVLIADGLRFINSVGVQRLHAFLQALTKRSRVFAERCSPSFVTQLNLMPSLSECMTVRSVIAPLECMECVAETDILIAVGAGPEPPEVPARRCEVCGAALVLAELEERYFAFLRG
jgi:hypothetical protein